LDAWDVYATNRVAEEMQKPTLAHTYKPANRPHHKSGSGSCQATGVEEVDLFILQADRLHEKYQDDPTKSLWVSVLRNSWVRASWVDSACDGKPFNTRSRRERERCELREARLDAIDFWAGVIDPDSADTGIGEDGILATLQFVASEILEWDVYRLRAEATRRLRGLSPVHRTLIDDALARAA